MGDNDKAAEPSRAEAYARSFIEENWPRSWRMERGSLMEQWIEAALTSAFLSGSIDCRNEMAALRDKLIDSLKNRVAEKESGLQALKHGAKRLEDVSKEKGSSSPAALLAAIRVDGIMEGMGSLDS